MKTLAVCIYGQDNNEIKEVISKKYSEYLITFFEYFDSDLFKSLWTLSVMKCNHEIIHFMEFDICMAVLSKDVSIFETTPIVDVQEKIVYFHSGKKIDYNIVDISLTNFYSKSLIFDRVCECYHHKHLSRISNLRATPLSLGSLLFCHIKSLMLSTSCINYENSNLFIRSTKIN